MTVLRVESLTKFWTINVVGNLSLTVLSLVLQLASVVLCTLSVISESSANVMGTLVDLDFSIFSYCDVRYVVRTPSNIIFWMVPVDLSVLQASLFLLHSFFELSSVPSYYLCTPF